MRLQLSNQKQSYRNNYRAVKGELEYPIRGNEITLIDAVDLELVKSYPWHALKGHHTTYAIVPGKTIYLHRLLLNPSPAMTVDHINGNGLDNRRKNLRIATRAQNQWHRGPTVKNPLGLKGVRRDGKRFVAGIRANNAYFHLGTFDSPLEAALAYNDAALSHHGPFGYINLPGNKPRLKPKISRPATQSVVLTEDETCICRECTKSKLEVNP